MRALTIRDLRQKEKFQVDDLYLSIYAKHMGLATTAVYISLCRHSDKTQQCFPSLKLIAEEHGISTKTVQRAIKKLREYNIIHYEKTRSSDGKWLRNTYFLLDKSVWKPTGHESPLEKPQDISDQTTGHYRPIKDTHKKETHIINNIYNHQKSLKDITEEDLIKISENYKVPLSFVKSKLDDLINYCESTGRRYKNYLAALRNFVKKDAIKIIEKERFRIKKGGFIDASE
jgi:DNA-binding transcriptional regulator GbsR (MarR family)